MTEEELMEFEPQHILDLSRRYNHLKKLRTRHDATNQSPALGQRLKDRVKELVRPLMDYCYEEGLQDVLLPVEDTNTLDEISISLRPLNPDIANVHRHFGSIYIKVESQDDGPLELLKHINRLRAELQSADETINALSRAQQKLLSELKIANEARQSLQDQAERHINPYTIEIQSVDGVWHEFIHNAPITLRRAEEHLKELKRENPNAIFRAVPWINNSQRQYYFPFIPPQPSHDDTDGNSNMEETIEYLRKRNQHLEIIIKDACLAMNIDPKEVDSSGASIFAMLISEGVAARNQKEICICSAIKLPNGEIVRGHRHNHCYDIVRARPETLRTEPGRLAVINAKQGFVTSRNRFVDRNEAMAIQRASGSPSSYGKDGEYIGESLFSEDLY